MSEFDIFFDEYENKYNCSPEKYECLEAGAQSKQAEIDEYKMVAESMEDAYLREKSKVDELRKRIDKVVHILTYTNHASTPLCNELRDILKGTTNEQ